MVNYWIEAKYLNWVRQNLARSGEGLFTGPQCTNMHVPINRS